MAFLWKILRITALKNLKNILPASMVVTSWKNPAEPKIVYIGDTDIVDVINTAYNYKKILSCKNTEQELSDISSI